eukprot:TRINITY_DN82291_c0_g1_i1.p1 TRINITY_DN82291_c0_g1~~TRINITY_DN82291_c0_g1_i1.p1  ORF type:complete len:270 (+),score=36.53 TRINITY_DN82291_c0_g1_i1:80-811(+)
MLCHGNLGTRNEMAPQRVAQVWVRCSMVLIFMHIFVVFRHLQEDHELAVIPWNFTFCGLAFFLFLKPGYACTTPLRRRGVSSIAFEGKLHRLLPLVALTCCMPLLCHVNCLDSYLSFSMYTGNEPELVIRVRHSVSNSTAHVHDIFPDVIDYESHTAFSDLNLIDCSFQDLGCAYYPALWLYKRLAAAICAQAGGKRQHLIFVASDKLGFLYLHSRQYEYFQCSEQFASLEKLSATTVQKASG